MSSIGSNETSNEDGLLSISIRPRRPANYAPYATAEGKSAIIEYYNKSDWETLESFCNIGISEFVKNLPTPILSDSTIYEFHFGAIAFKNIGKKEKYIACLKVLFSLKDFASHLNSEDQELLSSDVQKYYSLSEELGSGYLNNIQVAEVLKKSGCFIATTVYGSYYSPEVIVLRKFRNTYLLTNTLGKIFVQVYYLSSPIIAQYISRKPYMLRVLKKCFLDKIVKLVS